MTPKRWLALLVFYVSYLLFGASIYYHIESQQEIEQRAEELEERIAINELLVQHLTPHNEAVQTEILNKVSSYCDKPVTNYTLSEEDQPLTWSFYHSLFFAFTVCSTVGYGNLAPTTTLGRMIMILYSLIGIPINGILFAGLGDFFSRIFTAIYQRYKKYKMSHDALYVPMQFGLFATIIIALVPGITIFILLPALVFSYFEGWPYLLSIYYSYVTTTTIGFGDYVPTFQPGQAKKFGVQFIFYEIFIIFWFIFSLGYLVMIMTYITKGLSSKKLSRLEQQLSMNIKATQNRIWTNVTKDVGYLRRILNELYIMKFKPVYNEPGDKFQTDLLMRKSASCPDLTMYKVTTPIVNRKRAFSENFESDDVRGPLQFASPARTSSDTDLQKINKEKTFRTAQAFMQTTDLLAKVVTALGNIRPPADDVRSITSTNTIGGMYGGYHGLSDSQILNSEKTLSGWSLLSSENSTPYVRRPRAASDFYISPETMPSDPSEWTWSGDNHHIQQVINRRVKTGKKGEDLYRASFQAPSKKDRAIILNVNELEGKDIATESKDAKESDNKSFLKRLKPFKKHLSEDFIRRKKSSTTTPDVEAQNYLAARPNQRGSMFEARRPSLFDYRRPSLFSVPSNEEIDQQVLETTTIADLIRALEVMHTAAELQPDLPQTPQQPEPRRKLGTASLTPPDLPPLFTLFSNNQPEKPTTPRRATIFGSLPTTSPNNLATSSRRLSSRPLEPPPYSEKETPKFKRRFSVRPSNLQTPPTVTPASSPSAQTALQRRLSVRQSPLAREMSTEPAGQGLFHRKSSAGRGTPPTSSSTATHSPLSRIAQLQAARKSSVTDKPPQK